MRRVGVFLVVIISLALTYCEIDDPEPDPSKFLANQTILDNYAIQSIAFDSKGTAWIGTFNSGLIKYSLTETVIYDLLNSPISNEMIWEVAVDSKDNIWIGSDGLTKYDGNDFTRFTTENSDLPEDVVWAIAFDSEDNVWLSSSRHQRGGLVKHDGNTFEIFTPENSPLPANSIHGLEIDINDNIWLTSFEYVSESYIVNISNNEWIIYPGSDYNDPPFIFNSIAMDSQGRVLAMYDHHFASYHSEFGYLSLLFHKDSVQKFTFESTDILRTAIADRNDNFWCGLSEGYAIYDHDTWEIFRGDQFNGRSVFSIAQSLDGNMWIGTGSGIDITVIDK